MTAALRRASAPAKAATALALVLALAACASSASLEKAQDHDRATTLLKIADDTRTGGDEATAATLYRQVHELSPKDPVPLERLGSTLMAMQDYPQAVAAWREAVALAPGNSDIHRGLALALIAQDKPQAAIGDLGVALAKSPDDPRLYNALGIAHDMMGRHDLAQQDYQRGLKIAPDNLGLRNNYGLSLVLSGKYADAIVALVQSAGAANASPRNRLNLALAYGLAGDDAKAAATARPVLDEKAVQSNLASYAMLRAMDPKQRTDAILGAELHGLPLSSAIAKATPDAKMAAIPSPHVETAALSTPSTPAAASQPSTAPAAPTVAMKPAAPVAPASLPAEHAPEFAKATPAPVKPAAADVLSASTPTAPAVEPSELAKTTPAPVQPAATVVASASTPTVPAVDHSELAKATPAPVQPTVAPVAPAAPTPLVFGPDGSPSAAPAAAAVSPAPPPVTAAAPVAPTEVAAATPSAAPVTAASPAPAPKAAPEDHPSAAKATSEHATRVRLAGAPGEHFVVQLGSFSVEALAQKLVDRFAAKGITLTMSRNVDREHRVWFVVRTAEVASSDEAQSALQQIKAVGGITPAIVRVSAMREPAAAAHAADIAPTADQPTSVAAQHAD